MMGYAAGLLRRARRTATRPAPLLLVLAPLCGEGLSGSSPPSELVLPWHLAFMILLYGSGALICREVAHRYDLGLAGLALLGAAYGVYEEALVDRLWFDPHFWKTSDVGDYSVVWHANLLLAVHLTAFHAAVSICLPVLLVGWLVPGARERRWVGRRGLIVAAVGLAICPVLYGEFDKLPPAPVLFAAVGLVGVLVTSALFWGRLRKRSDPVRSSVPDRRPGVGWVTFLTVLGHWIAVYGVAGTTIPWPLGLVIAIAPLAVGALVIRWLSVSDACGPDGVRVAVGIISFFAVLGVVAGLTGQYDLVLSGLLAGAAAVALYRRTRRGPAGYRS